MEIGICHLALIAMRSNPSEKAEMVSQILYGETYDVLDFQAKWALIRTHFDEYEGWISRNQFFAISPEQSLALNTNPQQLITSPIAKIKTESNTINWVSFGSRLSTDSEEGHNSLLIEGEKQQLGQFNKDLIIPYAKSLLGIPYFWGGRSVFGFDCSGFTQMVFKSAGYQLFRDASQQVTQGETIGFIQEILPGDLLFFDDDESKITHVAIVIDSKTVIHASGHVKIDMIDHYGIFSEMQGKYTHHLRLIKRI